MNYRVLLYYNFVADPETEVTEHLAYCQYLGLIGRVYIAYMQAHHVFSGIVFKVDEASKHAFHTIHVRVKPELVNLQLDEDANPKLVFA